MSTREKLITEVQARTDSVVYSISIPTLSKDHLSLSLSESEPEHPRVQIVVYEPIISKAEFMDLITSGNQYRRLEA